MRRAVLSAFAIVVVAVVALAACSSEPESGFRSDLNKTEGKKGAGKFGDSEADPTNPATGAGTGVVAASPPCDDTAGNTAEDFAHTLGICDLAAEKGYGLVSATFTRGRGTGRPNDGQHNTLTKFGARLKPREGKRLGVLSTGFAQEFNGGAQRPFSEGKEWSEDDGSSDAVPQGFPKAAGNCAQANDVHDVIGVKLELKAPKDATGFRFDFNFHSSEWPDFVCSEFNDGFIAYLSAKGFNGGVPDNISFDAKNNPVSVNNGFFDRCTPDTKTGCEGEGGGGETAACAGGADELAGTGFGLVSPTCSGSTATQGGATGWLSSHAPVEPGETFTLEFMIWDTGDGNLDSTVLLDRFQWIGGEVKTATERSDEPK